jgi:hypothetical protein
MVDNAFVFFENAIQAKPKRTLGFMGWMKTGQDQHEYGNEKVYINNY